MSESHRVDKMIQHILTLSRNPQLRDEFSQNALQYVQQNFLWEKNIHILTGLIENDRSLNQGSNE